MPNRKYCYSDMKKYQRTAYKQKRRYYSKTAFLYERRPWTEEEDKFVLEHKITDTELSNNIHRSVNAIQIRRVKLNKKFKNN